MEYNYFYFEFLETVRHPAASLFVGYIGTFHFDNSLPLKVFFNPAHKTHNVFCRVLSFMFLGSFGSLPSSSKYLTVLCSLP